MNQVHTHAATKPDAVAFRYLGAATTWRETADHMDAFAAALQRRGVGFGDRVPINIRLTPPVIAYIVDDADADVLIVEQPLAPLVGAVAQVTDRIRRVIVIGDDAGEGQESYADLVAEPVGAADFPNIPEDTTALIMYTSGTTDRPKGAMLDHGNLFAQALTLVRVNRTFDESDVAFMTAPCSTSPGSVRSRRTSSWASRPSSTRSARSTQPSCWTRGSGRRRPSSSTCRSSGR